MQLAFIERVKQWGWPKTVKVDNGRPFGDPLRGGLPPLALWLIGMGVDVVWNRPRTPQDNAKVERCQSTLATWTEFENVADGTELTKKLKEQAQFYNYDFRDRRQGNQTRIERFPDLVHSGRCYEQATFDSQRVADFIGKGSWQRTVSKVGQISMPGGRFSIGQRYAGQLVTVKFCPQTHSLEIFNSAGQILGKSKPQYWDNWIRKIEGVT